MIGMVIHIGDSVNGLGARAACREGDMTGLSRIRIVSLLDRTEKKKVS